MKFQRPKGTEDLYNQQVIIFSNIISELVTVAKNFNYQEIITPVIESADLFLRSIGSTTNIVEKEIYQFLDKGKRNLALRPEGTAGVIRAVAENKLYNNQKQTLKYFYYGNMYRYENPQKGRNREFHQFGVEVLGTKDPLLDVEVIVLAAKMLEALNINDYQLAINFFGSETTKTKFNHALSKALMKVKSKLPLELQTKIKTNPLRILDAQEFQTLNLAVPEIAQFYSPEEKAYFATITKMLTTLKINFNVNQTLVRGLDYYNGVIFEFVSNNDALGKSQNTLIGGGRYDNLAQELGVPYPYPAIGFAFGIERLMLLLANKPKFTETKKLDLFIISQFQTGLSVSLLLLNDLRKIRYFVDGNFSLFNDKQKSNLIKSIQTTNNLLVLEKVNQATCYQLTKKTKVVIKFENQEQLLTKIIDLLKISEVK